MFGDKVNAREQAKLAGIPMIPGSDGPIDSVEDVYRFVQAHGFPVMLKAVNGGGGRGMRMVNSNEDLETVYNMAKSEAMKLSAAMKFTLKNTLESPKHIEVQILGDTQGNIVHLFERDCSVQRRHQKLVEIAPAFSLKPELRKAICDAAVKLMKNVNYLSAGTVEFLVTPDAISTLLKLTRVFRLNIPLPKKLPVLILCRPRLKLPKAIPCTARKSAFPNRIKLPASAMPFSAVLPPKTLPTTLCPIPAS